MKGTIAIGVAREVVIGIDWDDLSGLGVGICGLGIKMLDWKVKFMVSSFSFLLAVCRIEGVC